MTVVQSALDAPFPSLINCLWDDIESFSRERGSMCTLQVFTFNLQLCCVYFYIFSIWNWLNFRTKMFSFSFFGYSASFVWSCEGFLDFQISEQRTCFRCCNRCRFWLKISLHHVMTGRASTTIDLVSERLLSHDLILWLIWFCNRFNLVNGLILWLITR